MIASREAADALASAFRSRHRIIERNLCGWTVNPYVLCDHRCTYCVTGVKGRAEPVCPPDRMTELLRGELAEIPDEAALSFGGISDAYPRVEEDLCVSRAILPVLLARGGDLIIVTKGRAVLRDIDLLRGHPQVGVAISIGLLDDHAARRFEPFAPPPSERLAMVDALREAGIDTEIQAVPWIPGASNVAALLARIDDDVRVTVAPLNIELQQLEARRFGPFTSQEEIDAAYLVEARRVGAPDNVQWLQPPSTATGHCLAPLSMGRLHREHLMLGRTKPSSRWSAPGVAREPMANDFRSPHFDARMRVR